MLPSNPLQHLLLQALARPIVMTSGNLSGRPPALSNAQALNDLADIADGFLCIIATSCSGWMIRWCGQAVKCCAAPGATSRTRCRCRRG
jgi:hypothetical protein